MEGLFIITSNQLKQKILPVKYPPITSYPDIANFFSIVLNYKSCFDWVVNEFIYLEAPKQDILETNYFGMNFCTPILPWKGCPYLSYNSINRDIVDNKWSCFIDFLIDLVNYNYYINVNLNMYFIPLHKNYRKSHSPHKTLVYGYNYEKMIFNVADFYKDNLYTFAEISFSDIELSYRNFDLTNEISKKLPTDISMIKLKNDCHYTLDIQLFIERLKDYLSSINPRNRYKIPTNQSDKSFCEYGMNIYGVLQRYLDLIIEDKPVFNIYQNNEQRGIDIRNFYTLCDHKKIIFLSLEHLYRNGYLNVEQEILKEFKNIKNETEIMYRMLLKYKINNNKAILEKIKTKLIIVSKKEKEILEIILKNVHIRTDHILYQKEFL